MSAEALMDAIGELEGRILTEILDKVARRGEEVMKLLLADASASRPRTVARSATAFIDAAGLLEGSSPPIAPGPQLR